MLFPAQSTKNCPVARLSSVFCLWFHQDIVIQLYLAQWYSPDNVYIILHRWFPCLFFFFSNWIRSSKTPRLSSWRCRCCSQLAPSHYQKIMTRHMTLDDQLNSTLQFTYLILQNMEKIFFSWRWQNTLQVSQTWVIVDYRKTVFGRIWIPQFCTPSDTQGAPLLWYSRLRKMAQR